MINWLPVSWMYQTLIYWIIDYAECSQHPLENPMWKFSALLHMYWTFIHRHIQGPKWNKCLSPSIYQMLRHAAPLQVHFWGLQSFLAQSEIFIVNETALFRQMLSSKTLNVKDSTCHGGKISKMCVSLEVAIRYQQEQINALLQECKKPSSLIHIPQESVDDIEMFHWVTLGMGCQTGRVCFSRFVFFMQTGVPASGILRFREWP